MKEICSINGEIKTTSEAVIPLSQIEFQYGFGVYETIKVRNSVVYFIDQHIERLFHSATLLSLQHHFKKEQIKKNILQYVKELGEESSNIKLLLYGSGKPEEAMNFILASKPLYPDRKWYKKGVKLMSYQYERWMPQAKSLNMVASYFIYKKAQEEHCYDALLYDRNNNILEGTRTNMYLIKDKNIYSAPKENILEGVTMMSLEKVASKNNFSLKYKSIKIKDIQEYDGMFLTSTSSKILPIKQVDNFIFPEIHDSIFELIKLYDEALDKSKGEFNLL